MIFMICFNVNLKIRFIFEFGNTPRTMGILQKQMVKSEPVMEFELLRLYFYINNLDFILQEGGGVKFWQLVDLPVAA